MRMRKKKNLPARLIRCAPVIPDLTENYKGRWLDSFTPPEGGKYRSLRIETGCGKGAFIRQMAVENPDVLFAAVEKVPEALVMAAEGTMADGLSNVRFLTVDAARLGEIFASGEAEILYLNFSDPWPSKRHAKRRLTHRSFLSVYLDILKPGGKIILKTDNDGLFDFSLEEMSALGLELLNVTRDLHSSGIVSAMTEYEKKFSERGENINYTEAVKSN